MSACAGCAIPAARGIGISPRLRLAASPERVSRTELHLHKSDRIFGGEGDAHLPDVSLRVRHAG